MKVYKVADIVNSEVIVCEQQKSKSGDLATILTHLVEAPDTRPESVWTIEIETEKNRKGGGCSFLLQ